MARGGGGGEWSAHFRMYEFQWLFSPLGLDFEDLLHVLGLDACGAH
jgi:hypothetical protein